MGGRGRKGEGNGGGREGKERKEKRRRDEGNKEKYKIRKNLYKNTKELEYFGKEYKGGNRLCTQMEVHD